MSEAADDYDDRADLATADETILRLKAEVDRSHKAILALTGEVERLRTYCPECGNPGECACIGNWRERASSARADTLAKLAKVVEAGSALHFVLEGYRKRGEMVRAQWQALDELWRSALAAAKEEPKP
jgi:hypothetical protein